MIALRLVYDLALEPTSRLPKRVARWLMSWAGTRRLERQEDRILHSLAHAIKASLLRKASNEEAVWVRRIEGLRKELEASTELIPITHYGVGTPGSQSDQGQTTMTRLGENCRRTSKEPRWAFLLFKMVRELEPEVCLELGTSFGISAAYQAAALELNGRGRIVTLEGAESKADIARANFVRLGLGRISVTTGRFQDTLDGVLRGLERVDFAFIDGHHDEQATLRYFEQITPFLSRRAVVVIDDTSWSMGMRRVWQALEADDRVKSSVDLRYMGICVMGRESSLKRKFRIPLG